MSIVSVYFILFFFGIVLAYFAVPKKYQWVVLLIASCLFYLLSGWKNIFYILFTATSLFFAALAIARVYDNRRDFIRQHKETLSKEEKNAVKKQSEKKARAILIAAITVNVAILVFFKYLGFLSAQITSVFGDFGLNAFAEKVRLLIPLGISFYTFQSIGYIVDVYWENVDAEKSFPKFFLFISFFPQITQGPISTYKNLAPQLTEAHSFDNDAFSYGCQRMLWGFFKKLVIADNLASVVSAVFAGYGSMQSISVFLGMLCYSVQIYADFSGYMDIMCGLCQTLGIRLTENFMRPYFSKSVAEYWRRWHISLGDWFKTYVYYPVAVAGWNKKFGKRMQKVLGGKVAQTLPASFALVAVWLLTGLWHGASWAYVAWGAANGLFIIFDLWMEPVYQKVKGRLRIDEGSFSFRAFQTIRTFILITFIKTLPEVDTLSQGLGLWKQVFTGGISASFIADYRGMLTTYKWAVILLGIAVMFAFSLLQRKHSVRDLLRKHSIVLRWALYLCAVLLIVLFGTSFGETGGGFMYAQF